MSDASTTMASDAKQTSSDACKCGCAVEGKVFGLLAEFETPGAILSAAKKVNQAGFKWWDCCVPFPVHGLDKAMGVRPTILPWIVLGAGITGAILGALLQWYTNATNLDIWSGPVTVTGYAFLVSGKPLSSIPTWIPVIFELTILLAAISCVVFMFVLNKLPQFYHPCFNVPRFARVTDDRFFIVIEARDPNYYQEKTAAMLTSLGATAVEEVPA